MATGSKKDYTLVRRKFGLPEIKEFKNRSGNKFTSDNSARASKAAASSARWDSKGTPTHGESVPGATWKPGTPGYVAAAAQSAERHAAALRGGNFTKGGKQGETPSHRVPVGGKGAPDVKREGKFPHDPHESN